MSLNIHATSSALSRTLAALISALALSSCYSNDAQDVRRSEDSVWIDKAIEIHFGEGSVAHKDALSIVDPVVIYLQDTVCVGLRLKENSIGGDYAVCFSREDGSVKEAYIEGE